MRNALYKLRLVLLGVFVSLSLGTLAQVGGGSGISARVETDPTFDTLTVSGESTFSGQPTITSTSAALVFTDTDADTDEKQYSIRNSAGQFRLQTRTDGSATANNAFIIDRTGTTVDEIELNATALDFNATLDVSGSADFGDSIDISSTVLNMLTLSDSDAAADNKKWSWRLSDGDVRFATLTDANSFGENALSINRTGTSVDEIQLDATTLDVNGTLDVSGSATVNDDLTIDHSSPTLFIHETNASANEGEWRFFINAGRFDFETRADGDATGNDIITVERTGTTVDSINLKATDVQTNGVDITAATGTFTLTLSTGCTTSPSGTATYSKVGNSVVLEMPTVSCTSNSLSKVFDTDIPTAIRPASSQETICRIRDNGAWTMGLCVIETNGDLVLQVGAAGDFFTNSGTAALGRTTVSYLLN